MMGELDHTFTGTIDHLNDDFGWFIVQMPDSALFLGTGRAAKVAGSIDGEPFQTAFMPNGAGGHFLPVSKALRKKLGKDHGDEVTIHLEQRLS